MIVHGRFGSRHTSRASYIPPPDNAGIDRELLVSLRPLILRLNAFSRFGMHPCLSVDEVLGLFACELVASGAGATAVALARCCKSFEEPVLGALWEEQERLAPLLKCFPRDVWEEDDDGSFVSPLAAFTPLGLTV